MKTAPVPVEILDTKNLCWGLPITIHAWVSNRRWVYQALSELTGNNLGHSVELQLKVEIMAESMNEKKRHAP